MAAFDEMLALEEKVQSISLELGKARDMLRTYSRRIVDARTEIQNLQVNIDTARGMILEMKKEGVVVLLSEYDQVRFILRENQGLIRGKKQDIVKIQKQIRETQSTVPFLEAKLKQIETELNQYGQALSFP